MQFIDTHTHLHFEQFDADRDKVLQRAQEAGVSQIITLGTDAASSRQSLALANQHSGIFAAAGIHPSEAHLAVPEDEAAIKALAQENEKMVAIGEIGLDFYWDTTHHQAQYDMLRSMLALGKSLELPVVMHNRSAHREFQWFFQQEGIFELNGVMHCFYGEIIDAKFYLNMGLHISFTANITHSSFRNLEVIKYVPLDRLMIETDSPYIAPAQVTEKRNEPANLLYVAERLAEIHRLPLAEIARITSENARRLFKLPAIVL